MIILWSGSIASIPKGWTLCNGSNDTPDLRNRFVVGAGSSYSVDDVGGLISHDHSTGSPDHEHAIQSGSDIEAGTGFKDQTSWLDEEENTGFSSNLPPYFALAYIMKL